METRSTILVIDDTADIAELLRGVLTKAGYRVLVARTVQAGLQILAAFRIGLVLTDALTPADEADSIWVELDQLAHAARATPLVLYAAEPERYAGHVAHGFTARLAKPLDLDALLTLIDALLFTEGQQLLVAHQPAAIREG